MYRIKECCAGMKELLKEIVWGIDSASNENAIWLSIGNLSWHFCPNCGEELEIEKIPEKEKA